MAESADRVIVELLARTDNFDVKVKQSASAFEGGAKRIEGSAAKVEKATDQAAMSAKEFAKAYEQAGGDLRKIGGAAGGAGTQIEKFGHSARQAQQRTRLLGFQIGDIGTQLAAGTSPFLILAQQGPQVANAMDGAKGSVGRFATFLSGPWGAALLTGTAILGAFLLKNRDTADSIEDLIKKLKEKAQTDDLGRQAQEAFTRTTEGAVLALRKMTEEIENQNRTLEDNIALTKQSIQANLATVKAGLPALERQLAEAREDLRVTRETAPISAGLGADASGEIQRAAQRVKELEATVNRMRASVAGGERALIAVDFPLIERNAEAAANPISQLNLLYDRLRDKAEKAALSNRKLAASLQETLNGIEKNRAAAIKTARDKPSTSLPKVTLSEVQQLLQSEFGATITSTTGGKHAKNSYHYAGRAVDFVPKGGMAAFDKEMVRLALEARGIKAIELLGPGDKGHSDHGHIAFSAQRQGPDQIAAARERAAQKIESAALAEERRQQSFDNELASANQDLLDARRALETSAEKLAQLEILDIEIARAKYDDNVTSLAQQKKLTTQEADELRKLNNERAGLRGELVQRREQERRFRESEAAAQRAIDEQAAGLEAQASILQSQEGLARTQAERREIELRLLDLQFQEERLRLQAIIAQAERLRLQKAGLEEQRAADSAARIAQAELDTLPDRQANATADVNNRTAGPIEDLLNRMPKTAADISEAFEAIAADGLDSLADAITGVTMGTQSLSQAFSSMAQGILRDIIQMTIRMLLFRALTAAFGMGGTTPPISGATGGGFQIGGMSIPGMPFRSGRATGGPVRAGQPYTVGEHGRELFVPAQNGRIIPSNAMAANGGGTVVHVNQTFVLDARHGITTPELLRHVNQVATSKAAQAGRAAYDAGQRSFPERLRRFQRLED